jgi:hypothetical protein
MIVETNSQGWKIKKLIMKNMAAKNEMNEEKKQGYLIKTSSNEKVTSSINCICFVH